MSLTHPEMTFSEAYHAVIHLFRAGITPMIHGSPGIGKSMLFHKIAKEFNLELIDVRLSQCAPEDLQGLPMKVGNKSVFVPFNIFPTEEDELPPGKDGWLLFLDEFTSAARATAAAAYKLVLDHEVGQHKLHPKVLIAAAGNRMSDNAIVNTMSTATQSRLGHIILSVNKNEFIDHAILAKYDHRIIGYIEFQPDMVHKFDPNHQELTFPCPRTWEFVSRVIKNEPNVNSLTPLISGLVGPGPAVQFVAFCEHYQNIPRPQDIIAHPDTAKIPSEISTKYAVMTMLMSIVDDQNIKPFIQYISRFPPENQVVFFRHTARKDEKLMDIPEFGSAFLKIMRFAHV
jgi:hypothetical protein